MGDVALEWGFGAADLVPGAEDLGSDEGLRTAIMLSLFTDRRAEEDDPRPSDERDLRGWWADELLPNPGDRWGSRLWLLDRSADRADIPRQAEEYDREALAWLLEDKVTERIDVEVVSPKTGWLHHAITVWRPEGPVRFLFEHVWTDPGGPGARPIFQPTPAPPEEEAAVPEVVWSAVLTPNDVSLEGTDLFFSVDGPDVQLLEGDLLAYFFTYDPGWDAVNGWTLRGLGDIQSADTPAWIFDERQGYWPIWTMYKYVNGRDNNSSGASPQSYGFRCPDTSAVEGESAVPPTIIVIGVLLRGVLRSMYGWQLEGAPLSGSNMPSEPFLGQPWLSVDGPWPSYSHETPAADGNMTTVGEGTYTLADANGGAMIYAAIAFDNAGGTPEFDDLVNATELERSENVRISMIVAIQTDPAPVANLPEVSLTVGPVTDWVISGFPFSTRL